MTQKNTVTKALVISDIHIPLHDKDLIEASFTAWKAIAKSGKLEYIFLDGDIIDCYALSTFNRCISLSQHTFESELTETRKFLKRLRKTFPKQEIIFVEGNHEYRLRRIIMEPKDRMRYEWMDKYLHFDKLLELDKLKIQYVQHDGTCGQMRIEFGDCLIGHWGISRNKAGATAHSLMDKYQGWKIVQGHVHKGARVGKSGGRHPVWAIENPCMCPITDLDYVLDPNWQQGFTVLTKVNETVHAEMIIVEQDTRSFVCEGKLYFIKNTNTKKRFDPRVRVG